MNTRRSWFAVQVLGMFLVPGILAGQENFKRDGAFGFPQAQAQVLCDQEKLRVSAISNGEHLYVQAILWGDDDDAVGVIDGRETGDLATIVLDLDSDGTRTPTVDRTYSLSKIPQSRQGLHYSVVVSDRGSTRLFDDSIGRGSIEYAASTEGKRTRIDCFLIPLAELGKKTGESLRLAYWGRSPKPDLIVNSIGFDSESPYSPTVLPMEKFHNVKLADGPAFDSTLVPEGRKPKTSDSNQSTPPAPTLAIGSRAPALDIEHWVQNGKGKFDKVAEFVPGKVFMVEFWATWCGPCIAAMPHIIELQEKFADQDFQVVSISDEKLEIVEEFLKRPAPGQKDKEPKTYGELTSAYCLTTDPDRSNHDNYMKAAGQTGIPCTFIVGKDGFIEWIGHPMSVDKALTSVLKGDWNREAFVAEYKEGEKIARISTELMDLTYKGRFEEALSIAAKARDEAISETAKQRAEAFVRNVLGSEVRNLIYKSSGSAAAKLESLLSGQSPTDVNDIVWRDVVLVLESGRKVQSDVLQVADRFTQKAVESAPEDSHLLDTYVHLLNHLGRQDRAVEMQQVAEWSKLVGVWKATREDGTYRIKRITKGNEVLENYSAQGELLSSRKSDMKLDRHYGLNFFTVRIGTPYEWTSIYKVYNGKWYEQLRGIFAEGDQVAPDAFLIYERVKD